MRVKILTLILALSGGLTVNFLLAAPTQAITCTPPQVLNSDKTACVDQSAGDDEHLCPAGSQRGSWVKTPAECNVREDSADGGLMDVINTIINVVIGLVGLLAVIVIILGGISFITSQEDPGKVSKAKNAILYGIVGLIVAILAFAIVNFVLSSVFAAGA